jgi:hypothetical protein
MVSFDPSAIKIGGPSAVRGRKPWENRSLTPVAAAGKDLPGPRTSGLRKAVWWRAIPLGILI